MSAAPGATPATAAAATASAETTPFPDGVRSVTGRRWVMQPGDARTGLAISQRFDLPEIVGRIMAARGIGLQDAAGFLSPSLRRDLPDPFHLRDMDRAVTRIMAALAAEEKIAIFGDYDVDGATTTAMLVRFFRAIGGHVTHYIPDRIREGYGPNAAALLALQRQSVGLVITVDCGTTAFAPLAEARKAGLDVIVVDHHMSEPELPECTACINPNRLDDDSPHGRLAAVGVGFLLLVALNRRLREAGHYGESAEPDLLSLLDLVALGTICDVMPLTGLNRTLVAQGLKVMARRRNRGLAALADVARVADAPGTYHAGFLLGPRINAGGRVGAADMGTRLLLSEDEAVAADLAQRLDHYNAERREIEQHCLEEAIAQVEADGMDPALVYAHGTRWHPGVIGIVAGRLKERYGRPACVVAVDGNGVAKGSGRSIPGIDLGAAVIAARQSGLLNGGGGHAMAAGFTLMADDQGAFRAWLAERLAAQAGPGAMSPPLMLDGALHPAAASIDLARDLESLQPFGVGNPQPRFVLKAARVLKADIVGTDHVKCLLGSSDGTGPRLQAIAFRAAGQKLGDALFRAATGPALHIAGSLRLDRWMGKERVQFHISDAADM